MRFTILILFTLGCLAGISQKKIRLYEDEEQMKEEILRHFPLGTDTLSVVKEMTQNKFESYTFVQDELWKESKKVYDKADYLIFRRTKSRSFWISTTWIIRMLYNDQGQITEIIVEVGYTGP